MAGAKLWRLLPPQYTHLLYDRFGREKAPDFDADASRPGHFPNLAAAREHVIQVRQVCMLLATSTCTCCMTGLGARWRLMLYAYALRSGHYPKPAGASEHIMQLWQWCVVLCLCAERLWSLSAYSGFHNESFPALIPTELMLGDRSDTRHFISQVWWPELSLCPSITKYLTCGEHVQDKGEAIFVPSGWHHMVANIEDTLSINHK